MQIIDFFDRHGGSIGTVLAFIALLAAGDFRRVLFHFPFALFQRVKKDLAKEQIRTLKLLHGNSERTMIEFVRIGSSSVKRGAGFTILCFLGGMILIAFAERRGIQLRERQVLQILIAPFLFLVEMIWLAAGRIFRLASDLRNFQAAINKYSRIAGETKDDVLHNMPERLVEE